MLSPGVRCGKIKGIVKRENVHNTRNSKAQVLLDILRLFGVKLFSIYIIKEKVVGLAPVASHTIKLIISEEHTYPDLLRHEVPWSIPAVVMGPDRLLRPLSELDTWGGRLTDVVPNDARCASARSLDTNLPGLVLYEESSPRLLEIPPGSGSRLLWAEGGRTGDIGGVFQAARTSSGG